MGGQDGKVVNLSQLAQHWRLSVRTFRKSAFHSFQYLKAPINSNDHSTPHDAWPSGFSRRDNGLPAKVARAAASARGDHQLRPGFMPRASTVNFAKEIAVLPDEAARSAAPQ